MSGPGFFAQIGLWRECAHKCADCGGFFFAGGTVHESQNAEKFLSAVIGFSLVAVMEVEADDASGSQAVSQEEECVLRRHVGEEIEQLIAVDVVELFSEVRHFAQACEDELHVLDAMELDSAGGDIERDGGWVNGGDGGAGVCGSEQHGLPSGAAADIENAR